MNILTNVDMNKNQVLNMTLQQLAMAPANPTKGQIYFSTQSNTVWVWNGNKWLPGGAEIPDLVIGNVDGLQSALDGKVGNERVLTDVPINAKFTDTVATKANIGLGNVDNTSDANKPVSNAVQEQLNLKETIANVGTKMEGAVAASKQYTDAAVTKLTGAGVSEALDTLKELATALGNDPNFSATITTQLGLKTNKYKEVIGNGSFKNFSITHNLDSRDVIVQIRQTGSPYEIVFTDVELETENIVKLKFAVAPSLNEYSVTVIG